MTTKIKALSEKLDSEYELEDINKLKADLFVYSYAYGSYDGSGFAVWKRGAKWFYSSLGHCSCDGPTSFLKDADNAGFTWKQVEEIGTKENYDNHAVKVIDYIRRRKLNE